MPHVVYIVIVSMHLLAATSLMIGCSSITRSNTVSYQYVARIAEAQYSPIMPTLISRACQRAPSHDDSTRVSMAASRIIYRDKTYMVLMFRRSGDVDRGVLLLDVDRMRFRVHAGRASEVLTLFSNSNTIPLSSARHSSATGLPRFAYSLPDSCGQGCAAILEVDRVDPIGMTVRVHLWDAGTREAIVDDGGEVLSAARGDDVRRAN